MTDLIIQSLGMYALTIVISMLAALLIKLIVVSIAKSEERRKRSSMKVPAVEQPVPSSGVDPRHVAAISAAVYSVLGSHRIVHIADSRRTPSWAAEGKRQLQSSHNVHRIK